MQALLITGLVIRLAGVGLMIHARSATGSDAALVWTQILQGLGGGFAAVCSGVGAQAAAPHADVAMVIALVLLWTEIGGGVGGSVAGAIWAGRDAGEVGGAAAWVERGGARGAVWELRLGVYATSSLLLRRAV